MNERMNAESLSLKAYLLLALHEVLKQHHLDRSHIGLEGRLGGRFGDGVRGFS